MKADFNSHTEYGMQYATTAMERQFAKADAEAFNERRIKYELGHAVMEHLLNNVGEPFVVRLITNTFKSEDEHLEYRQFRICLTKVYD